MLHLGLVAVRFHCGGIRKPIVFMISRFSAVYMIPETNYIQLRIHKRTPNNSKENETILENLMRRTINILESQNLGKGRRRKILKLYLLLFEIFNMKAISSNRHEMENLENLDNHENLEIFKISDSPTLKQETDLLENLLKNPPLNNTDSMDLHRVV